VHPPRCIDCQWKSNKSSAECCPRKKSKESRAGSREQSTTAISALGGDERCREEPHQRANTRDTARAYFTRVRPHTRVLGASNSNDFAEGQRADQKKERKKKKRKKRTNKEKKKKKKKKRREKKGEEKKRNKKKKRKKNEKSTRVKFAYLAKYPPSPVFASRGPTLEISLSSHVVTAVSLARRVSAMACTQSRNWR